jgi:lipopolysaccharide biosynthesis glycosyltransferase
VVEPVVINSGFMVIDRKYRGAAVHEDLNAKVRRREGQAHMLDQIIINGYFQGRGIPVRLLPHAYNFRTWGGSHGTDEQFEELRDEIRLVHYSGYSSRPKPWDSRATDELGAVRVWRESARGYFGNDFVTRSTAEVGKATG